MKLPKPESKATDSVARAVIKASVIMLIRNGLAWQHVNELVDYRNETSQFQGLGEWKENQEDSTVIWKDCSYVEKAIISVASISSGINR